MGQDAICHSKPFANAIGDCLIAECSMRQTMGELFGLVQLGKLTCGKKDFIKESSSVCGTPPINLTREYRLSSSIIFAIALVFFALRIGTKVKSGLIWGMDDTLTTLSVVSHQLDPLTAVIQQ
jgi:hypothetical protein